MATLQVGITHAWSEEGPSNRVTQNLRTFPKQPQALHDPNRSMKQNNGNTQTANSSDLPSSDQSCY